MILRDEDDKEYFLKPGFKITILGQGEPLNVKTPKEPKTAEPGTKAATPAGQAVVRSVTPVQQQPQQTQTA